MGKSGLSDSDGLLDNGWGLTVNDSVESVDCVSGVGDGTDGTIGLNKGVLSLDDISVTGLLSALGVSGEGIRDRVSVVVLWVRIIRFRGYSNGLGNWLSIGYWSSAKDGLCHSDWGTEEGLSVSYLGSSTEEGLSIGYLGSGTEKGLGIGLGVSWTSNSDSSSIGNGRQGEDGKELEKLRAQLALCLHNAIKIIRKYDPIAHLVHFGNFSLDN